MEPPYSERNNQIQFSDFTGDSGIAVPIVVPGLVDTTGNLPGTTVFAGGGHSNSRVDRNDWAPRLGFAYALNPNTVIRAGWNLLRVERGHQFSVYRDRLRRH